MLSRRVGAISIARSTLLPAILATSVFDIWLDDVYTKFMVSIIAGGKPHVADGGKGWVTEFCFENGNSRAATVSMDFMKIKIEVMYTVLGTKDARSALLKVTYTTLYGRRSRLKGDLAPLKCVLSLSAPVVRHRHTSERKSTSVSNQHEATADGCDSNLSGLPEFTDSRRKVLHNDTNY
ncbi:hypothetical protein EVAR_58216_1 [Eumeta japonica]|uniref:Uncharacterized protein n=1 Tax=Eumeta variegata TaxID=151549 RepID=A0A4C1ZM31_EUMVA|nr:hypothetical protein EVAR_58216_1 [Eumeta japonica]